MLQTNMRGSGPVSIHLHVSILLNNFEGSYYVTNFKYYDGIQILKCFQTTPILVTLKDV
jgi:hypothetical protein